MKNKQPLGPDQRVLEDRKDDADSKRIKEKVVIGGTIAAGIAAIVAAIFGGNNNNNNNNMTW